MALCFAAIAVRAVHLHLFPTYRESLDKIADNQYQREIELAPYRGTIFDRRGEPLAISIRRPSLAINPRAFNPNAEEVRRLSSILKLPERKVRRLADRRNHFAWLSRQLDHRVADEALGLGLAGLFPIREPARFYPAGGAASHLLGFVGLENTGLGGLERQFDKDLRGQALKILAAKDARGNFIFDEALSAAPLKTGHGLTLTIDRVIQEIAEDELEAGVKRAKAKKGYAIVSDPHTGKILAIANYPGFDPNHARKTEVSLMRNHALLDVFEPGSVTKPFIIAAALEAKVTTMGEDHDCEKGVLKIGKDRIHDTHPADHLTTEQTIVRSSNICTYKIAQRLGKQKTREALTRFGFAGEARLGFPGESIGRIAPYENWKPIRFANVAFGHGFLITGLELVQAMGAIANGGNLMRPSLVDRLVSEDGLVVSSTPIQTLGRAAKPETARILRNALSLVVTDEHGTATKAATKNYTTAGKTGTAQKVDPGIKGYAKDKYIVSFVGFAPVGDPHLVIYVYVDEPREKPYYGGVWAAPVFSAIAERSLKYLNVAPDLAPPEPKPNLKVGAAGEPAKAKARRKM